MPLIAARAMCSASRGSDLGTAWASISDAASSFAAAVVCNTAMPSKILSRSLAASSSPSPHSARTKVRYKQQIPIRRRFPPLSRDLLSCKYGCDRMQASSYVPNNSSFKVDASHARILPQITPTVTEQSIRIVTETDRPRLRWDR